MGNERQWRRMFGTRWGRIFVCKEVWYRTLVIIRPGSEKIFFYERGQSTRNLGQIGEKDAVGIRWERVSNFPCFESIVQRSIKKQRLWEIVVAQLLLQTSSICTEQSQKCAKNMKPFMIERCNPLSEGNRVPPSCQAWSRQKFLWIVMTMFTRISYCKKKENELKSYHSKTNSVNFVWMQDSSMLLKLDSITWRKILQNSHNSQMQWLVVNALFQERKKHLNQKVGSEGTPKLETRIGS